MVFINGNLVMVAVVVVVVVLVVVKKKGTISYATGKTNVLYVTISVAWVILYASPSSCLSRMFDSSSIVSNSVYSNSVRYAHISPYYRQPTDVRC